MLFLSAKYAVKEDGGAQPGHGRALRGWLQCSVRQNPPVSVSRSQELPRDTKEDAEAATQITASRPLIALPERLLDMTCNRM